MDLVYLARKFSRRILYSAFRIKWESASLLITRTSLPFWEIGFERVLQTLGAVSSWMQRLLILCFRHCCNVPFKIWDSGMLLNRKESWCVPWSSVEWQPVSAYSNWIWHILWSHHRWLLTCSDIRLCFGKFLIDLVAKDILPTARVSIIESGRRPRYYLNCWFAPSIFHLSYPRIISTGKIQTIGFVIDYLIHVVSHFPFALLDIVWFSLMNIWMCCNNNLGMKMKYQSARKSLI